MLFLLRIWHPSEQRLLTILHSELSQFRGEGVLIRDIRADFGLAFIEDRALQLYISAGIQGDWYTSELIRTTTDAPNWTYD